MQGDYDDDEAMPDWLVVPCLVATGVFILVVAGVSWAIGGPFVLAKHVYKRLKE